MPDDETAYRDMQRRADAVGSLIVATDYPAVDVAIEARKVREFAVASFPGQAKLFDMIYASRFRRLWQQWRPGDEPLPDW